ncbi:pilus assembly protein TadE, partial [Bifidobacterium animalis subsp. lactis]
AGDGARIEVRPAGIGFEVIAHCAVVADPWGIVPRMVTGRAHGIWQERL